MHNEQHQFVCKNTFIRTVNNDSMLTASIDPHSVLKIPIAHGEGKFFADEKTLSEMNDNGQILFRYCDEDGNITAEANPNGTTENIAGICNDRQNVFGMMPHPERASEGVLGNTDGKIIFESLFGLVGVQRRAE